MRIILGLCICKEIFKRTMSLREDNSEETERTWGQRERESQQKDLFVFWVACALPQCIWSATSQSVGGIFWGFWCSRFPLGKHVEIASHNSLGDSSTSRLKVLQEESENGPKRFLIFRSGCFPIHHQTLPNSTFLHKDSQFRKQLHSLKTHWCWWLKTRSTWSWLFMQRSRDW